MATAGPLIATRTSHREVLHDESFTSVRLAIVAYPRTASVVIQTLADRLLAESGRTLRTHDPLLIRTLVEYQVPVLIPIRDPRESILSWSVYNDDPIEGRFLQARCHSYLAWAREVRRLSRRFPVHSVALQVFASDPQGVLHVIVGGSLETESPSEADLAAIFEDLDTFDTSPVNQQHISSESRERMKNAYRPLLASARIDRLMRRAADLNDDILACSAYVPGRTQE